MNIPQIIKIIINYGPKILKVVAPFLAGGATGAVIMARIKDKAYKELKKKHDKETAKQMAKQFNKQLEQIKKEHKENEEKMKKKMIELCKLFGLDPIVVLGE